MQPTCKNSKTPAEIALAWADASARGDLAAAAAMLAPNLRRYGGLGWQAVGRDFYVERWGIYLEAFSPYVLTVVNHLVNGRTVALEMIESATFSRPYRLPERGVIAPNFESYTDHVCTVVDIGEDGLIHEIRAYIPSNLEALMARAVAGGLSG